MPPTSDEELMQRYANDGDRAAFEELFRRYVGPLTAMFSRTGGSEIDALDLVQQTFLQLHNARHDYKVGHPVRPWLYAIALNVGRGAARRSRRRREDGVDDDRLDAVGVAPNTSTPTDRAVHRALDRLPDDQREVIVLHWFDGLEFSEISRVVDASLSAVKVRAHRGYNRLRELLTG
jgi:RNA polymerase sigma factor (sigma-70 family)